MKQQRSLNSQITKLQTIKHAVVAKEQESQQMQKAARDAVRKRTERSLANNKSSRMKDHVFQDQLQAFLQEATTTAVLEPYEVCLKRYF